MYEFGIINSMTGAQAIIFGYSIEHAFKKAQKDFTEWTITYVEYVD